jgi:hypothetical protein
LPLVSAGTVLLLEQTQYPCHKEEDMVNKIRFMLEYQCSPIWLENEGGELLGNELPDELSANSELNSLLREIQDEFDGLYENNDICFEYHGFSSAQQKKDFFSKVAEATEVLRKNIGSDCLLQVDVNPDNY